MEEITIKVRYSDDFYRATCGSEYLGVSPDEALGYCIRELWLGGTFLKPVKLELDLCDEDT